MTFLFYWEIRSYNQRLLQNALCLRANDPKFLAKSDHVTRILLIGFISTSALIANVCMAAILANKLGYTKIEFLDFQILMASSL